MVNWTKIVVFRSFPMRERGLLCEFTNQKNENNANRKKLGCDYGFATVRMAMVIVLYVALPGIALFMFETACLRQPPKGIFIGTLSGWAIALRSLSHGISYRPPYSVGRSIRSFDRSY